jgi:2'-5' RNA ligase
MSSNLVIAAIPDQNDQVWKVSSEKIPHLTLLFLGDSGQVSNLDQIMLFVEHAASTSLKRFYLPVDYRGELGADKADVLFFKKGRYDFAAVRDFRSLLLKDTNIKTAYDSAKQFEEPVITGQAGQAWIPHLTLGYPKAPAKPLPNDMPSTFYDVSFNRIAVWTGDFEGPEFMLKDYWEDLDEMDIPMDVAMSDIQHFGVKGMHWGVRRAASKAATGAKATSKFVRDVNFETRTARGPEGQASTATNMVASASRRPFKKEDLPAVKARHGDYAKLTNRAKKPFSPEAKAYRKDARETYVKRLETTANSMKNASGTRQYTVRERGIDLPAEGGNLPRSKYFWEVSARDVKHATSNVDVRLELVMADGYITDLKPVPVEDSMAQTAELGVEFLAHLSEEPWSNFTKADYTTEQWHAACLIHTHDGAPTSKSECKLPVKTPDGVLNRNGVHAAAAALAGARGGLKGVSDDQKKKAAGALRRYYAQLDEDPPESLAQSAVDLGSEFILEHFGIKGMHWGQRKSPPSAVSTSSSSVVPHGTRRKTKIQVEGGQNHPAHADAVKVAEAKAKLKKSGTAALSNQELRDMANRLQLENQVALLTSSKGKQFVSREFETSSKQLIKRGTKQGVKRYGPTVAKKAGKAAATAATIAVL